MTSLLSTDEIVTAISSFYDFLISFYLPESSLKTPPPGGWPDVSDGFFNPPKSKAVMELLRALPYIDSRQPHGEPFQIYGGAVCVDYAGYDFEGPGPFEAEDCHLAEFAESMGLDISEHTFVLAAASGENGCWWILDVQLGIIQMAQFEDGEFDEMPIAEFFEKIKEKFRLLEAYPTDAETVEMAKGIEEVDNEEYRKVFHAYGWPGEGYQKAECMREIKKTFNSMMGYSDAEEEDGEGKDEDEE